MGRGKNRKRRNKHFQMKNGELVEVTKKEVVMSKSVEANALDFRLEIPDDILQKVMWWIHKASHEVSGFGSLEFIEKDKLYRVTDVILLKQAVAPTSTEICPTSLGKAMFRMKDQPGALKWHWHSHVDMGVFWSADDRELIRSLGQQGWIMATVFNKKKEMLTAFQTQCEIMGKRHDIFQDAIPTFIQKYLPTELCQALDKEYEENVSTVRTTPSHGGWVENDFGLNHWAGKIWKNGAWVDDDELSEARWYGTSKTPIMAHEYDKEGWVKCEGRWWYNPCYDKILSQTEKLEAINEMAVDEIEFLKERSPSFESLLRQYVVLEAQKPLPTVDELPFVEA